MCNLFCSLVYGMVPFLNAILGTMLPMLSMAKQDNIKWVFSSGKNHLTCFPVVSQILTEQTKQKVQLHDVHVFALPALYSHTAFLFPVLLFFLSLQLCLISATVSWSTWPTQTRLQILQSEKTRSPVTSMLLLKSSSITGYKAESPRQVDRAR